MSKQYDFVRVMDAAEFDTLKHHVSVKIYSTDHPTLYKLTDTTQSYASEDNLKQDINSKDSDKTHTYQQWIDQAVSVGEFLSADITFEL